MPNNLFLKLKCTNKHLDTMIRKSVRINIYVWWLEIVHRKIWVKNTREELKGAISTLYSTHFTRNQFTSCAINSLPVWWLKPPCSTGRDLTRNITSFFPFTSCSFTQCILEITDYGRSEFLHNIFSLPTNFHFSFSNKENLSDRVIETKITNIWKAWATSLSVHYAAIKIFLEIE